MNCWKCGGSGVIPKFNHVEDGKCFACNGTGTISAEKASEQSAENYEKFKKTGKLSHLVVVDPKQIKNKADKEAYLKALGDIAESLGYSRPSRAPSSIADTRTALKQHVDYLKQDGKKKSKVAIDAGKLTSVELIGFEEASEEIGKGANEAFRMLSEIPKLRTTSKEHKTLTITVAELGENRGGGYSSFTHDITLSGDLFLGDEPRNVLIHEMGHAYYSRYVTKHLVEDSSEKYGYSDRNTIAPAITSYVKESREKVEKRAKELGYKDFDIDLFATGNAAFMDKTFGHYTNGIAFFEDEVAKYVPSPYSLRSYDKDYVDPEELFAESFMFYVTNKEGFRRSHPYLFNQVEEVIKGL